FEKSFAFLKATPCDILLTAHPDASDLWDHLQARQEDVKPDPLVNTNACRKLAEQAQQALRQRIAAESAN
ncbi:MAG TPA: hypothetical protein VGU90_04070, partial [Terriglobales bacterium]|nr:hypothetical protein [Terriglobales bacterium]